MTTGDLVGGDGDLPVTTGDPAGGDGDLSVTTDNFAGDDGAGGGGGGGIGDGTIDTAAGRWQSDQTTCFHHFWRTRK